MKGIVKARDSLCFWEDNHWGFNCMICGIEVWTFWTQEMAYKENKGWERWLEQFITTKGHPYYVCSPICRAVMVMRDE